MGAGLGVVVVVVVDAAVVDVVGDVVVVDEFTVVVVVVDTGAVLVVVVAGATVVEVTVSVVLVVGVVVGVERWRAAARWIATVFDAGDPPPVKTTTRSANAATARPSTSHRGHEPDRQPPPPEGVRAPCAVSSLAGARENRSAE